jgi:hypothetical protein
VPGFLPPAVARRMARDDAREAIEARRSEADREAQAEERHERALDTYRQQAEARGEVLDVMALARGEMRGRGVSEILASAAAAAAADDRRDEMRAWRDGHGDPEKLHVFVGEPNIVTAPAARSATGWKIFNRARHFRDMLDARRQLEQAERAAWQSRNGYGLVDNVTVRPREDRDNVVFARHAAASSTSRPAARLASAR